MRGMPYNSWRESSFLIMDVVYCYDKKEFSFCNWEFTALGHPATFCSDSKSISEICVMGTHDAPACPRRGIMLE